MAQAPRWTIMGKSPRTASVDRRPLVPDPGSYSTLDPGATSKMTRSPRAAFGSNTSVRQVVDTTDKVSAIPGPGYYKHEVGDDLGQVPRQTSAVLSTPRARDRPMRASTPDPGYYVPVGPQTTSKMGRSPSYGFANSRAARFPMLKERGPGPGSYANREDLGKGGAGFERATPRMREHHRPASPDPGAYVPVDPSTTSRMTRSPRTSFDGRSSTGRALENGDKKERKETVPGPGSYAHKDTLGDTSGVNFLRSSQRVTGIAKSRIETPDPGAYNALDPSATSKMPKQAGYGFGSVITGRIPVDAENGIKTADETVDENGIVNGTMSPRGSFGSPRGSKRDNPGPGAYNVVDSAPSIRASAPHWGFSGGSVEVRPSLLQRTRAALQCPQPGPGTYVANTAMGVGPKFTMRGRSEDRRTSTPGPGTYGGQYTQFDW